MRLNRVELFYAFMLHFYNEGNEEKGRLAMANPPCRPATHGQAGCNQGPPTRGWPPARAAAHKRVSDYGRGASRKAACEQKHRPLPAASPQGAA
ncbi:hypothetical protein B296_00015690 [Ensete ventricosum]|uniref:Uncharacterized protein n=1 Tax=Ensete ventricosum TaxID=4639 RepID=A0A426ZDU9_ENSVE|nr:hypothetical protein B296_00015690 [Ensete ventricosum]